MQTDYFFARNSNNAPQEPHNKIHAIKKSINVYLKTRNLIKDGVKDLQSVKYLQKKENTENKGNTAKPIIN